jgi:hypothetical protein
MTLKEKLRQMGIPVPDPLPDSVIDEEKFPLNHDDPFKGLVIDEDDDRVRSVEEEMVERLMRGAAEARAEADYFRQLYEMRDFMEDSWRRRK